MTSAVTPGTSPLAPWLRAPDDITHHLLGLDADCARILQAISSRELKRISDDFLEGNKKAILTRCVDRSSPLTCAIDDREGEPSPSHSRFYASLVATIRSFGIRCPNKILSLQEIDRYNDEVNALQDTNLERIWPPIRAGIAGNNPGLEGIPEQDTPAQEIRTWMHAHLNLVQEMTELFLDELGLTCVPTEIALFRGLLTLSFTNNQLTTLPSSLFCGLQLLETLFLDNNPLRALPPHLFQGLEYLTGLYLNNNQLSTLPPGLFDGQIRLETLGLENNQLGAFPPKLFDRLWHLEHLYIFGNPELLITWDPLTIEESGGFLKKANNFFKYHCLSPCAELYQLTAGDGPPESIRHLFHELNAPLKNTISWMVYREAGCPNTLDPQWGEHHALDNMPIFRKALKNAVRAHFDGLTGDQKNAVYRQVFISAMISHGTDLLRKEKQRVPFTENDKDQTREFNDPQWGEHHAKDNIPRLIDAIHLVQKPSI